MSLAPATWMSWLPPASATPARAVDHGFLGWRVSATGTQRAGRSGHRSGARSRSRNGRQIQVVLAGGPGQRNGSRAWRWLGPPWLSRACPATATAVDKQAIDRIRDGVQGRADHGKAAERIPLLLGLEEHLENNAPPVRMPRPVAGTAGQRSLDQYRVMLFLFPWAAMTGVKAA